MTTRRRLPDRRPSEVVRFRYSGLRFDATAARFPDGRLAEVFLDCGKSESAMQSVARDLAVTASLALQFGCPAETLRHSLTKLSDGSPAGPLGHLLEILEGGGDD